MITSKRVSLAGEQLDELDNRIVIRSVDTGVPHEAVSAVSRMGGYGMRMTSQHWETLEVGVTFAIDVPKRNMALRREIFDTVKSWAMKCGWLTTNEQPGKRMYADKCVIPNSADLWDWTDEYTIIFRAYNVPFWQDAEATTVTGTLASGNVSLFVHGNVESVLDVTFENTSGGVIDNFSISVSSSTLNLTGINLANGSTLTITHGTDGILRIRKGVSTSLLDKRSGSDDLYAKPGTRSVAVVADGEGVLTVSNYGRYV